MEQKNGENNQTKNMKEIIKTILIITLSIILFGFFFSNCELNKQISSLTTQNNLLNSKNETLGSDIKAIRQNYASLKTEYEKLSKKYDKLEKQKKKTSISKSSTTTKKSTKKKNTSSIVYITNTGSKYHRSYCSYLRQSKISISLKKAKSYGYTPCSRCNP